VTESKSQSVCYFAYELGFIVDLEIEESTTTLARAVLGLVREEHRQTVTHARLTLTDVLTERSP